MKPFLTITILLFFGHTGFSQTDPNPELIERLETFNKLYGYVKYFHPSDEAAALDWDAFSIYGVEQILKHPEKEFKTLLEELFLPVAPTLQLYHSGEEVKKHQFKLPDSVNNPDTIRWQHIGNGNFNTALTYKSLRTGRPREYFPVGYLGTKYLIDFPNVAVKEGDEFKIRYNAYNETDQFDFETNIDVCFFDKETGEYECTDKGGVYSTSFGSYSEIAVARKNFDGLALQVAPSGWGIFRIGGGMSLYKKEKGEWGRALEKVEWKDSTTVENSVKLVDKNDEFVFHQASFEHVKTLKVYTKMLKLESVKYQKPDSILFKPVKEIGDTWDTNIGSDLYLNLPLVLLGDDDTTFPIADQKNHLRLVQQIENKQYHKKASGDDLAVRIANVINSWNVIHHFYPYFDVLDVNWYEVAKTSIVRSFIDQDKYDHTFTLEWMLAHLEDAHIYVDDNFKNSRRYYPPFHVGYFNGKYLITAISEEADENIKVGDELVSINKVPIDELVLFEQQYVSAKVLNVLKKRALKRVIGTQSIWEKFEYTLKSQNDQQYVVDNKLKISSYRYYKLGNQMKDQRQKFVEIDKNFYYLNLYLVSFEEFYELANKLSTADKLIIDMRGYPDNHNGNIRKILGHFTKDKIEEMWMFTPKIAYPDRKNYMTDLREKGWEINPQEPYIGADIYYLINGDAQSYSESISGFFDATDRVTMIGTPTAGANGNVIYFNMPGGYTFRFTGMRVLKQNGERLHGIGFLPDVEVVPTAKGLSEGRDEVLEKAIELASANASTSDARKKKE